MRRPVFRGLRYVFRPGPGFSFACALTATGSALVGMLGSELLEVLRPSASAASLAVLLVVGAAFVLTVGCLAAFVVLFAHWLASTRRNRVRRLRFERRDVAGLFGAAVRYGTAGAAAGSIFAPLAQSLVEPRPDVSTHSLLTVYLGGLGVAVAVVSWWWRTSRAPDLRKT